ncbi:uncharacterized protein LOC112568539 isoform X2 [Pomacea canaliculata]|uniref:uncharacterized protein LOC112568539 isoform X2 n=1 Tax=Pomacea canaliculata TaxID=400727 RepID=UPI000D732F28|nr:uncharacterized protein LOC112568539 isoform X2 [Pomacea canaliculata]
MGKMVWLTFICALVPKGNTETSCDVSETNVLKCNFSTNVNATQTAFSVYFQMDNIDKELLVDCVWLNNNLSCLNQEGIGVKQEVSETAEISLPTRFVSANGTYRCQLEGLEHKQGTPCQFDETKDEIQNNQFNGSIDENPPNDKGNTETSCDVSETNVLKCNFSTNVNTTQTDFSVYFQLDNINEELLVDCAWLNHNLSCLNQEGIDVKQEVSETAEISLPTRFVSANGTYRCQLEGLEHKQGTPCQFDETKDEIQNNQFNGSIDQNPHNDKGNTETSCDVSETNVLKCNFSTNVNATQTAFSVYFQIYNIDKELLVYCAWLNHNLSCLNKEGFDVKQEVSETAEISLPTRFVSANGTYRCNLGLEHGKPSQVDERKDEIQNNQFNGPIHENPPNDKAACNCILWIVGGVSSAVAICILGLIIMVTYMHVQKRSGKSKMNGENDPLVDHELSRSREEESTDL